MKVALFQQDISWSDIDNNLDRIEQKISQLDDDIDLVVLPEMFTTGFDMNPKPLAEPMEGKTHRRMQVWASTYQLTIIGSIIIRESDFYFNRCLCIHTNGRTDHYDKRHLFSFAGEDQAYQAGTHRKTFRIGPWTLLPQICYDLRFPVWSRNDLHYDIMIYMANWPAPRIDAWQTLLKARAIENQCYVLGVNRVGKDPNGHLYPGSSSIIRFDGQTLQFDQHATEQVLVHSLSQSKLLDYRRLYRFLDDRDTFQIK